LPDVEPTGERPSLKRYANRGGEALFCKTDVTSEEDVAYLMRVALGAYGSLDVLVNYVTGAVIPVDAAMSSGNFLEVPWKEPDPRS
jgi:NAD(P)-dependent dehydrogenase (short-subunit alcohol dehydrogenase family)